MVMFSAAVHRHPGGCSRFFFTENQHGYSCLLQESPPLAEFGELLSKLPFSNYRKNPRVACYTLEESAFHSPEGPREFPPKFFYALSLAFSPLSIRVESLSLLIEFCQLSILRSLTVLILYVTVKLYYKNSHIKDTHCFCCEPVVPIKGMVVWLSWLEPAQQDWFLQRRSSSFERGRVYREELPHDL